MKNLVDYFEKLDVDKISHSFLIGNVFYDSIKDDLQGIISKYIFNRNISIDDNPDIYVLNIENDINRNQIRELINDVSITSQFNNSKVYIIANFEDVSASVYNAILKNLEEPRENIYAFLITNNINSINSTITSRCQKIFLSSGQCFSNNDEINELSSKIIKIIESNGVNSIGTNYDMYTLLNDKDTFREVLKNMLLTYSNYLRNKFENYESNDIIINGNEEVIAKKILIINDKINKLDYNLNKNLLIDRFIIEMWRCNNEGNRCRV